MLTRPSLTSSVTLHPFRRQTEADLKAARWSLLAWEDPHCPGRASPFWADASTVEAVVVPAGDADGHALLHVARRTGARFHGLRLRDGTLIVKFVRVPCAIAAFMSRVFNDGALELPSIHSEGIAAIAVIVDALGSLPGAPGVESRGELREIVAEIRPDFG